MKICTTCGETKAVEEFSRRSDTGSYRSSCRACVNASNLLRYHTRPDTKHAHRKAARKFSLKRYGLTVSDFENMYETQGGRCAICSSEVGHINDEGKSAFVDHCHTTLKVRALLCQACNTGLGQFSDNPARLRAAANYVEQHATSTL
jgi:hypothetical protein